MEIVMFFGRALSRLLFGRLLPAPWRRLVDPESDLGHAVGVAAFLLLVGLAFAMVVYVAQ